jgi:hypothetical protein
MFRPSSFGRAPGLSRVHVQLQLLMVGLVDSQWLGCCHVGVIAGEGDQPDTAVLLADCEGRVVLGQAWSGTDRPGREVPTTT